MIPLSRLAAHVYSNVNLFFPDYRRRSAAAPPQRNNGSNSAARHCTDCSQIIWSSSGQIITVTSIFRWRCYTNYTPSLNFSSKFIEITIQDSDSISEGTNLIAILVFTDYRRRIAAALMPQRSDGNWRPFSRQFQRRFQPRIPRSSDHHQVKNREAVYCFAGPTQDGIWIITPVKFLITLTVIYGRWWSVAEKVAIETILKPCLLRIPPCCPRGLIVQCAIIEMPGWKSFFFLVFTGPKFGISALLAGLHFVFWKIKKMQKFPYRMTDIHTYNVTAGS